jgi:hypothetical protein
VLARPGHEDHARPVAGADEDVLCPGGAMHEVPRPQTALHPLDDQKALAGEHEEVLLVVLAVVHPVGLARLQHRNRVADLRKRRRLALEDARRAEVVAGHPRSVAQVDRKPPLGRGGGSVFSSLQPSLIH